MLYMGGVMEQIDQGIESTELIEAEIDHLIRRLMETDPDALLRIEKLLEKIRSETVVERRFQ
jgi:hypothetical protein